MLDPVRLDPLVLVDHVAERHGDGGPDAFAIADVGEREGLWVHADAAWGGAAALLPEMRKEFAGIERADSITFDAHKWLYLPKACGVVLAEDERDR